MNAETQRAVTDRCAQVLAAQRATELRANGYAFIGIPPIVWGSPIGERTLPRVLPLPQCTDARGNAHVRELAQLAAQDGAVLDEAVCTTLKDALFPAPDTQRLVIRVNGEDLVDAQLLKACSAFSQLEQLAVAQPQELEPLITTWISEFGLPYFGPRAINIAVVKSALFRRVTDQITRALPDDEALRQQVFATLARAEAAMHRVCQTDGLPRFENTLGQRQISLVTHQTNRRLLGGTVDIAFNSWHHRLSADGRVRFGDEPNGVFPEHQLPLATLVEEACFTATHEGTDLRSVKHESQFEFLAAGNKAAQPAQ